MLLVHHCRPSAGAWKGPYVYVGVLVPFGVTPVWLLSGGEALPQPPPPGGPHDGAGQEGQGLP